MMGCGTTEKTVVEETTVESEETILEEEADASQLIASAEETTAKIEVVEEGMVPIYGKSIKDGTYDIVVESSSSMFKIFSCELTVLDGQMTAAMKLEGDSYTKVYPGTGLEAVEASEDD